MNSENVDEEYYEKSIEKLREENSDLLERAKNLSSTVK